MSHCNGREALESVTFSNSHKKPRYEAENDVETSLHRKEAANVAPLAGQDRRVFTSALKEGSSNILDHSRFLPSEKRDQALCHTKCSTGRAILNCEGTKISSDSFGEDENGSRNITLSSDYPFSGKKGFIHHKKSGDISSANGFVSLLTKDQKDVEDDLQFNDCSNIGDFEDFDKIFRNPTFAQRNTVTEDEISWFSSTSHGFHGMKDTLQSVVLSSVSESSTSAFNNRSSAHGLCVHISPAIEPSAINNDTSITRCNGRKGKSILSELAIVHPGNVEKSLALERIGWGNESRDPHMINVNLKELYSTTGKKVNSTLGCNVQSSLCGCVLTHNVQNQELFSSVEPTPFPCYLQAISKQNLFSESYASNCLQSNNPQMLISDILKPQCVFPALTSSVIESNALPDHTTTENLLSNASQSIGIQHERFSMLPMPIVKNKEVNTHQKFSAALAMDKPLDQHATESDGSVQRKYKFEDEIEDDQKTVYKSGNLPAINLGSSGLQENSSMTSTFLDVSQKVANFQQLQMITDRLGVRTKLCIRDSLYRLARSAEQSHYYGTANNVNSGNSPVIGFQSANDSKRPPEILCVSISTNAIERYVAYLLFHKYLDSGTATTETTDNDQWSYPQF